MSDLDYTATCKHCDIEIGTFGEDEITECPECGRSGAAAILGVEDP